MEPEKKQEEKKAEKNVTKIENRIVQTYADDIASVIDSEKGGLVKKIIAGEEEHEKETENLSPESKKNRTFMVVSFVLLFVSLATLFYFLLNKQNNIVQVQKQFVPLIFNDQTNFFEVSGFKKDEIVQTVTNEINSTKVQNSGLEGIYLTENKQIIGLRRFISLTKARFVIPGDTTLINDNFLMGVVNNSTKDFFLLLKTRSSTDIFDSLRSWENNMFSDLYGFLGVTIDANNSYLLTKNFDDGIIENKNARILYDKDGKIVLMYIFADDNSVIVTDTQAAAHEIMLRLVASKTQK